MTKIALVGHCGIDGPRIEAQITSILDSANVTTANDPDALSRVVEEGVDLLLFNRELGFGFDDEEGVQVMAEIHESHPDIKLMLISDYPAAQAAAKKIGALPGFGKADLGTSKVEKALRSALS
jgi:DNA-binding NtrC family response regulator